MGPRNPYLFSDMTWGLMYVLHGLAGVGLITLVIVHVYFAVRPEKLPITASMIVGCLSRGLFYLKEHDPKRWVVESYPMYAGGLPMATEFLERCEVIEECYQFLLAYAGQGLPSDESSQRRGQVRNFLKRQRKR